MVCDIYTASQRALHYRMRPVFCALTLVMAEKQEHSPARHFHSCSSKLVCPVSLVSLLICTATLVRVEIVNQRVHDVEDSVADVQQIQNLIKVSTDEKTVKNPERVEFVAKFDHKITKERRDETEGKVFGLLSSASAWHLTRNLYCSHSVTSA